MVYFCKMFLTIALLTTVSFIGGFIGSIAGGGGLLTIPVYLLLGIPPQIALGTDKLSALSTTASSLFNFSRDKKVLWKIGGVGLIFSLIGGYLGTQLALRLESQALENIILILLPIAAGISLLPHKNRQSEKREFTVWENFVITPLMCLVLGTYTGFFGPGAGSFFILALFMLLKVNFVQASATAKIFALGANTSAVISYIVAGSVDYRIGIPALIASGIGGYLGSGYALTKGSNFVRGVLVVSLSLLFVSMVVKGFI